MPCSLNLDRKKLHKRFSSPSAHTSKSSTKISISKRPTSNSISPLEEAYELFTGYQEFFFLFLHELTFNFGVHLRGRMAKVIQELSSDLSLTDLETKVMKLQLLSRFLGYLVFSPYWHEASIDPSKVQSLASSNGLFQLKSLGISLSSQVQKAWANRHLIASIPWVTELLRMSKWDSCSQACGEFRLLLADLRQIQLSVSWPDKPNYQLNASVELVFFCLERFFNDTCGLPRLTSLPPSKLGAVLSDSTECLDGSHIGFSTIFLFASSPHLEDLLSLVDPSGKGLTNKSPSKTRKLRPSVVSQSLDVEPSRLFPEGENGFMPTPVREKASDRNDVVGMHDQKRIEGRLVEGFFHHHRILKEICEFAVVNVMREYPRQIALGCIRRATQEGDLEGDLTDQTLEKIHTLSYEKASATLETCLEEKVGNALTLFGPSGTNERVIKIAIRLTVSRAMLAGQAALQSTIASALQEIQRVRSPSLGIEATGTEHVVAALDDLATLFNGEQEALSPSLSDVIVEGGRVCSSIQSMRDGTEISIPTESSIRAVVSALLRLDKVGPEISQWCQSLRDEYFLKAFLVVTRLLLAVSTVSSYGLPVLTVALENTLVSRALEAAGRFHETAVFDHLKDLVEKNIVESNISVGKEMVPLALYLTKIIS